MLFSSKAKGFILDRGEQTTLLARVSALKAPMVIEMVAECASDDEAALKAALDSLAPKKSSGYLHAHCGISPSLRFVRRATLDSKRVKEPDYLLEILNNQFRLDAAQNTIAVINAFDGIEYDATKPNASKEVVFCGLPTDDMTRLQKSILSLGVFPERLELSTVATLGAIIDYLRFSESGKPTIVLELGADSTQSFIVSPRGLEAARPIAVGLETMVPVVQKELGLKDEESARKLFFSNTFDFTGMGASLCKRLLKELQSSMGFYEVQTGQSIGQVICTVLPAKLSWLEAVIASQIGVNVLQPDVLPWLTARNISLSEQVNVAQLDARKFSLLGLMMQFPVQSDAPAA
ncbi:MAG: hypothetical protein H7067_10320 [Burkholderiales bacterium]|nr:hypothetical protein [Opitutaceae bacterium]